MNDTHREFPIPNRQFRWYVGFWHVAFYGTLLVMMSQVLIESWRGEMVVGRALLLLGLFAIQGALYYRLIVANPRWGEGWPLPAHDLSLYFGGSLLIWWIEWRLEPGLFWLLMSYFGQMFGLLPPLAAIPGTTAIYLFIMAQRMDWDFSKLTSSLTFGIVMSWLSFTAIYLFIWYLGRTSVERGRLIGQLQTAQQQLALSRERDVELAALRERERLARDLHDSLGHALVVISVQLEAIQRLYRVDPERGSTHVDELKKVVRQSMDELRRSLAGLRTPGLGERSLSQALQALGIAAGQRPGITITCQAPPEVDSLRPAVAEALWRVAQESLTNIEKHAAAHSIQVILSMQPHSVQLQIVDDGVGTPHNADTLPGHYGLRGLRERIEGLGGELTITGGQQGTIVLARVPV